MPSLYNAIARPKTKKNTSILGVETIHENALKNKQTLGVQGGTVINKEAYSYNLTTPLSPSCASVFTHPHTHKKQDTDRRTNVYRAGIEWW